MKFKSTIAILLLAVLLTFTFIGCETNEGNNAQADVTNVETEPVEDNSNTDQASQTEETTATEETTQTEETDATEETSDTEETTPSEPVEEVDPDEMMLAAQAQRDAIPAEYKWDLEKVFKSNDAFMKEVDNVESSFGLFQKNKSNFTSNYSTFSKTLIEFERVRRKTDTIYVFATLQAHTNTLNTAFSDLEDIAATLDTDLSEATSYFLPAIANMDMDVLEGYMANEEMASFRPYVDSIIKDKEYILSIEGEELLAQAQILFETPESIYDAFKYNMDLDAYLPQPDFQKFWSGTREDKLNILNDYYSKTRLGNDLIAEIYESEIKKNTFFANARNFDSALDNALHSDGMTREAYNKVFEVTYDNLDVLHKWMSMKKEILGYEDQLHFYDQYTPLIDNPYAYVEYEDGKEIIFEALAPLGEEYIADLKDGLDSRWVDVVPTDGKYEGGYQWGTYDTDPFVLLNFNNYMTDVSTLAHEMGHALNFKYTNENQGYFTANVPIFNAEIASTTNEALVFEYRVANAETKLQKQQALLAYIELIENTIYTQMIYADFEKRAYEAYEDGQPINADLFNGIMGDVLTEFYGPDYALDDTATYQWSEIPHFYNAYYVYKYATGLSAGLSFADQILHGSQEDIDNYLDYLAAGSSEEPLVLLKNSGVDFSTGQPLQLAFDRFDALIDEFYETLK